MGPAFGGTHTLIQDGFVCHHVFISPDRTPTLSPHSAFSGTTTPTVSPTYGGSRILIIGMSYNMRTLL